MTALDHPTPLHHTEEGPADGAFVVAVHGWNADHRLMTGCLEPVFSRRGRPYRRFYPDLPGMGHSGAGDVTTADDILAALEAHLDTHVGEAPFLLLGESYGGYLARALASRRPGQVRGLALICPVGTAVEEEDRRLPEHDVVLDEAGADPSSSFAQNFVVQTDEVRERARDEIAVAGPLAQERALEVMEEHFTLSFDPEAGEAFEAPTLVVTGRQDAVVGYLDQWELLEHYPRATFAVLDAAGHSAQIERGAVFEALVHDWLDRVEMDYFA